MKLRTGQVEQRFGNSDSFDRNTNEEDISPMSNDFLYGGNPLLVTTFGISLLTGTIRIVAIFPIRLVASGISVVQQLRVKS